MTTIEDAYAEIEAWRTAPFSGDRIEYRYRPPKPVLDGDRILLHNEIFYDKTLRRIDEISQKYGLSWDIIDYHFQKKCMVVIKSERPLDKR